jgi:hypothetical protein
VSDKQTIVIAWVNMDGSEPTGRLIRPDGVNTVAEYRSAPKAHAVVWLNRGTDADVEKALAHAAAMMRGDSDIRATAVLLYPQSERDPLGKAKVQLLREQSVSTRDGG